MDFKTMERIIFNSVKDVKRISDSTPMYFLKSDCKEKTIDVLKAINNDLTIFQHNNNLDNDFEFYLRYLGVTIATLKLNRTRIKENEKAYYKIKSVTIISKHDDLESAIEYVYTYNQEREKREKESIEKSTAFINSLGFSDFESFKKALRSNLTYEQIKSL